MCTADFGSKLASAGIEDIRTPYRAPLANSVAERVVRTFRQECLDHVIVLNERHLLTLLTEFLDYYNHDRPQRTLDLQTPVPSRPKSDGVVVTRAILGDFITRTAGPHDQCTFAVLQPFQGYRPLVPMSCETTTNCGNDQRRCRQTLLAVHDLHTRVVRR